VFYRSHSRLSFYGQLLEQLYCCLTVRTCCIIAVLLVVTVYFVEINDDEMCPKTAGLVEPVFRTGLPIATDTFRWSKKHNGAKIILKIEYTLVVSKLIKRIYVSVIQMYNI